MLLTNQHPKNKSVTLSILGRPNAGKSTLINTLIGFDLNIVTDRAQTTRNRVKSCFTIDHTEVVLVDTPGIHRSGKELNKRMNEQAREACFGTDWNLILIDSQYDFIEEIKSFKKDFEQDLGPAVLIFTKIDKMSPEKLGFMEKNREEILEQSKRYIPNLEKIFFVSAPEEKNIHEINGFIVDIAEYGPHYYSEGAFSDKKERFFVTEYIREQLFNVLKEEIPYETAVVIDEYNDSFQEKERVHTKVSASILVNRPSQRGIVIGKSGALIKQIGDEAKKRIESLVGNSVSLNLHVKVSPRWFKNNFVLSEIGLPRAKDSARVWRTT
ncbi:GTPase Era [Bacteriovoracaceae bacterium]|nr:GTPase Era [Bacteriovoracaceae bacterium]